MAGRASVGVRGRRPRGAGHRCRGRCGRLRYGECRAWCRVMKWRSPTCPQRRHLRALHAGEMLSNTELRLESRSSKKRQRCGLCLPINVRALRLTFPRNSVLTPHHSRVLRINHISSKSSIITTQNLKVHTVAHVLWARLSRLLVQKYVGPGRSAGGQHPLQHAPEAELSGGLKASTGIGVRRHRMPEPRR